MSGQHDPSQAPSASDQQMEQVAEQAHAEIARLHEHAMAELESASGAAGKHSLPPDEPAQGEQGDAPSSA